MYINVVYVGFVNVNQVVKHIFNLLNFRIQQVLEEHKNDDQELAITGEPVIGWPESAKVKKFSILCC